MPRKSTLAYVTATVALSAVLSTGCQSSGGHLAHRGCKDGACSASAAPAGRSRSPAMASSTNPSYDSGTSGTASGPGIASRAQRTCPVTGEELGSMGNPISVTVKGETVLVCCKGCVKKVQQSPDKYLAKVRAETGAGS